MPELSPLAIGGIALAVVIIIIVAVIFYSQPTAAPIQQPPPALPVPLPPPPPPITQIPSQPDIITTPPPETSSTDEGSGEAPGSYTKFEQSWASWLDCRNDPNYKNVGLDPTICTVDRDKLKSACDSIPACFAYGYPDTTGGFWNNTGALFQFSDVKPKSDWRIWAKNSYL